MGETLAASDLLYRKITIRLIPILFICYGIAAIDRVNVGFARLQMSADLSLSATSFGFGAGLFFWAYALLETPSNLVLHRIGARVWLTRIMVTWGVITIGTAFIQTSTQYYVARLLLGAAEAGFYPGVVYYLSQWFPERHRGQALSLLFIGGLMGLMLVGPFSTIAMTSLDGVFNLNGWRWMFIASGLLAVVAAPALYYILPDDPDKASWLSGPEKAIARKSLLLADDHAKAVSWSRDALAYKTWLAGFIVASIYIGSYAIIFWLPSIIRSSGVKDPGTIGWLSTIPFLGAMIVTVAVNRLADRLSRRRLAFVGAAFFMAIAMIWASRPGQTLLPGLTGITIAFAAQCAMIPIAFTLTSGLYSTSKSRAAGLALVNTIGSFGSFFGPYVMGLSTDKYGSTEPAFISIAVLCFFSGLLVFFLPLARADSVPPTDVNDGSPAYK